MRIFFDPRQAAHSPTRELNNGDWSPYAETPERLWTIAGCCGESGEVRDHGLAPILAVHDAPYVEFLQSAHERWLAAGRSGDALGYTFPVVGRRKLGLQRIDALMGAYSYDAATPIAAGTWESSYWSSQAALSALDAIAVDRDRNAFALCRPPGHHAGPDYMGGYCYLNSAAIAARQAQASGLGPVAVLDVDYHHGNGTQDIFLEDPSIFFGSIHADPATDYPYFWGHPDERGVGEGEGATLNLPLPRGTQWPAYSEALGQALDRIVDWGARMLVVSFGADTYARDPISFFKLEQEDFAAMGRAIAARELPSLIVMEGGYAVDDLGRNVAAFLSGFD